MGLTGKGYRWVCADYGNGQVSVGRRLDEGMRMRRSSWVDALEWLDIGSNITSVMVVNRDREVEGTAA